MTAIQEQIPEEATARPRGEASLLRRWGLFVGLGVLLYLALYAWSEYLVYAHGERNSFFMINAAPPQTFDYVILGASHALPFVYEDMNERLEEASGASIMNVANEGAGLLPNRLVFEYFLERHQARNVIWFLDSFAFYSSQWNEERVQDAALFQRAPLDMDLARTLWRHDWAREMLPLYLSGFSKINNHDRFAPDRTDAEINKFHQTYFPIAQIDRQRIAYLYPAEVDEEVFARYLAEFEELIQIAQASGAEMIVVKPPTPPRYRDNLPGEAAFDAAIGEILARHDAVYYDYSDALDGDEFYYDTDHLNRDGVIAFSDAHFTDLLRAHL